MSRFVCSFVSDTSYRVEEVRRYELFKFVVSLLQFSVIVIKSFVTVVDSCLDQSLLCLYSLYYQTLLWPTLVSKRDPFGMEGSKLSFK